VSSTGIEVINMQETCKCGQNRITTETDGRFAYQVCANCKDIINVVYLGPKDKDKDILYYDEEVLGL
jgi:hypothetical protein